MIRELRREVDVAGSNWSHAYSYFGFEEEHDDYGEFSIKNPDATMWIHRDRAEFLFGFGRGFFYSGDGLFGGCAGLSFEVHRHDDHSACLLVCHELCSKRGMVAVGTYTFIEGCEVGLPSVVVDWAIDRVSRSFGDKGREHLAAMDFYSEIDKKTGYGKKA